MMVMKGNYRGDCIFFGRSFQQVLVGVTEHPLGSYKAVAFKAIGEEVLKKTVSYRRTSARCHPLGLASC
jgi:hypothetical protein